MTGGKECSVEGCGAFWGEAQRFLRDIVLSFNSDECLIWPYAKDNKGYGQIGHNGRTQRVSRFVCKKRHGPPPTANHQAVHSCGKGRNGCVNPKHLRWATQAENEADKLIHGTHNRGDRNGAAKLSEKDVMKIRALKGKIPGVKIAEQFGVSGTHVAKINRGEKWAWL